MDNHHEETTHFNYESDSVMSTGTSSIPPIVADTENTFSWSINECSSSFQSLSSCETLESYEHDPAFSETPKVIVVPFDNCSTNNAIAENVVEKEKEYLDLDTNKVLPKTYRTADCPIIKECSIRIDQTETPTNNFNKNSEQTFGEKNIIELPFNSNWTHETFSPLMDEESSAFEGFEEECTRTSEYEQYKNAANLITNSNIARVSQENSKTDTSAHRDIYRNSSNMSQSDHQMEVNSNSKIHCTGSYPVHQRTWTPSTQSQIGERISSQPIGNYVENNAESDSSENDIEITSVQFDNREDNHENNKNKDRSIDSKVRRQQKLERREAKKLEKIRRRKDLKLLVERIRDHWRESIAAKRKQLKKAQKLKMDRKKYENYHNENDSKKYQLPHQRKRKRISYSSNSDSSDTSSKTSYTSYTSSSTDSSNDSDTTQRSYTSDTSYTSQTTHRTDSDTSDSDSSSDVSSRANERFHFKKHRSSPSATSDTSDTSDDDTFDRRRKISLLRNSNYRKQFNENSVRSRKPNIKPKKLMKMENSQLFRRPQIDSRSKNQNNVSPKQLPKKVNFRSKEILTKFRKTKSEVDRRFEVEPTSSGNFVVERYYV